MGYCVVRCAARTRRQGTSPMSSGQGALTLWRMDERYAIDDSVQYRYVAKRDAQTFLPFPLPHLHAGLDILDAGCGVGSIALDIAPRIAPGRIVGIDIDPAQIEAARRSAVERGVDNIEFETASVYELPLADASFDIVYANAVLMHVRERVRALVEMRRVLRPGGLAAVSDDDHSTAAISPDSPELRRVVHLWDRVIAHAGGDAFYSRHLRTLMIEAGFTRTQGVAHAPEVYGDPASTRWFAELGVDLLSASSVSDVIIGQGWATRVELEAMIQAVREWGQRPDAFLSFLYCGALGWRG